MRKPPQKILKEFVRLCSTRDSKSLARHFNKSTRTIRHYLEWVRIQGYSVYGVPGPTYTDLTLDIIRVKTDNAIIAGDLEIPRHDPIGVALLCEIAERFGIKTLAFTGDIVEGDAFSKWLISFTVRRARAREEIETTEHVVLRLLRTFDEIIWVSGNHERRLPMSVLGELTYEDLLKGLVGDSVRFSEHSHCVLETCEGDFICGHPSNYSKIPLSVAREIAETEHSSVIMAHTHHLAMCRDKSDSYWCIDGGCLTDPNRAAFKAMKLSRHPRWNSGFVVLLNGVPHLIYVDYCDRDFWLGANHAQEKGRT